jgi:hypothetical protein
MTKRTRLFVLIAAGILVVGLGTGLLASYMNIQTLTLIGGNGPEEFAYVPADAQVLGFANVRAVMDSEVRRKLMELHTGADNGDRFLERTGINVTQDIDSVVAAVTPDVTQEKGPATRARPRGVSIKYALRGLPATRAESSRITRAFASSPTKTSAWRSSSPALSRWVFQLPCVGLSTPSWLAAATSPVTTS